MLKKLLLQSALRASLAAAAVLACPVAYGAHMNTPLDYAVSEGGSATLSIPVQVPHGIAGMEPQLSLSYSSGSGSGVVGLGWTLTGPSTISRCPQDVVNDGVRGSVNFDLNDRFCLDGKRLIQTGSGAYGSDGMTYRTQRDTFSRITSLGNYVGPDSTTQTGVPGSFKVETKGGLILEFGISTNSQVATSIAGAAKQTVNRWMLQRISDRTPNRSFIEFVYCSGSISTDGSTCSAPFQGSTLLQYIRYTNRNGTLNGENAVIFRYETRPDQTLGYHAGSFSIQSQRVTGIETYIGFTGPAVSARGTLVKAYGLGYEPTEDSSGNSIRATSVSRLVSLTERDPGGASLPTLSFTYATDAVFGQSAVLPTATTAVAGTPRAPDSCGGVVNNRISAICK
jgi:hypothetical protein